MGYEPKKPEKNKLRIRCPFRFVLETNSTIEESYCITNECALWLPIQRACSLQVIARGKAFPKMEY